MVVAIPNNLMNLVSHVCRS